MNTGDGDVELLSRAILAEAQSEAQEVQAAAKSKAEASQKQAQAEAQRVRDEIVAKARDEAARLRSQAISTAQLKARSAELEHREKLLSQVFEAAGKAIDAVPQRKDYASIAESLLREGIQQLNAKEIQVRADAATAKLLTPKALQDLSTELHLKLSLGQNLDSGIGVVVQTPDGHLQFDNTLQTRLARLRTTLRAAVYGILTGESK